MFNGKQGKHNNLNMFKRNRCWGERRMTWKRKGIGRSLTCKSYHRNCSVEGDVQYKQEVVEAPSFETAETKSKTLKIPNIVQLCPPPTALFTASEEAQPFTNTVEPEIFLSQEDAT